MTPKTTETAAETKADRANQIKTLREETARECGAEVEAVIKKHDCQLVGVPVFVPDGTGGWRIAVRIELTPKQ